MIENWRQTTRESSSVSRSTAFSGDGSRLQRIMSSLFFYDQWYCSFASLCRCLRCLRLPLSLGDAGLCCSTVRAFRRAHSGNEVFFFAWQTWEVQLRERPREGRSVWILHNKIYRLKDFFPDLRAICGSYSKNLLSTGTVFPFSLRAKYVRYLLRKTNVLPAYYSLSSH